MPSPRAKKKSRPQSVLEVVTDGKDVIVAAVDTGFRYTFFNKAYAAELRRLTGKSIRVGMNMIDLFAGQPKQQRVVHEEWSVALRGQSTDKVLEFGDPTRHRRIYRVRHTPIFNDEGLITGAAEVANDITGEVLAEEVRKDAALKAALLSQVNDGVVGADAGYRITYWGKGAERLFGFSEAEALGRTTLELLRPAYAAGEREKILTELDLKGSAVSTLRTKHKDGTEIIAEVSSTQLRDDHGEPAGFVVVYRDVTKRYRAEQALREANIQLLSQAEELQTQHEELQTQEEELRSQAEELRAQSNDLRLSEATLRGILDASKESIWLFDTDSAVLMANEIALARFRRPLEEVKGKRFREILDPDLARRRLAKLEEAVETATLVEFEDERAGIAFRHSFYPVFGPDGKVKSIACFSRDITAHKRAEMALRDSEAKANDLIKYAPTGIYEIDFRGPRFTSINDAMCKILGYSREELFAIGPAALLDEDSRARFADRIRRQLAGEAIEEAVEYRVRKKDGTWVDALLDVSIRPTAADPYTVLVVAHDITQRKRTEKALILARAEAEQRAREQRRDRQRYELLSLTAGRLLESQNPQAVVDELCRRVMDHLDCQIFFNFLVDKEAGRLRLNACAGIPEAEVRKLHWLDYGVAVCGFVAQNGIRVVAEDIPGHPDPRTAMVAAFGVKAYACHPLMAGSEVLGTLSFGAKNRTRFAEEDLSLMKMVAAQVAVAIDRMRHQRDLRERGLELQRLAETLEHRVQERTAELAAANERLKAEVAERVRLVAAVEQADEGVVIMDAEGRIRYANAAFEKLSGHSRDRLASMRYDQLLSNPEEDADIWASIRATIDRTEAWRGRVSRKTGGGSPQELDVTVSPIRDASRSVTSFLALERDVTQEVRIQQHLRQMQKMEALGTLAGGIAHDFNNILNPIFINTELLLLDTPTDVPGHRYLEITLKAAERGRDLVKQIIAFSRQKEKERKPCMAGPVVKEALKFLRVSLPATIEIRESIQAESAHILSDPAQIHQIVMNLCNNAAYAMREKGGVLEVSLATVELDAEHAARHPGLEAGSYLRLVVSDTGTGMTPEVAERAFDPFFTTKKTGEGSGMGLAVVNGIVRDHGGAISVSSEVGVGSTFTILLPRVGYEPPAIETAPDALPHGSERVLFIDDEDVQIQSVWSMLQRLGYEVVALSDGAEALAVFRYDPQAFDVVITDQTMPQMTGMKIAEEFLKVRRDVPIILCTGYSEIVDASGARALGIREFLMKPFSIREIALTLRRALTPNTGGG